MQWVLVQSLIRELRSHMQDGATKHTHTHTHTHTCTHTSYVNSFFFICYFYCNISSTLSGAISVSFQSSAPSEALCPKMVRNQCSRSVQFSSLQSSVMSDSLRPHRLQHARLPCPSPTPRVYSNSCTLSQWCHSTILSSVIPLSSCLQSFPASGSFPTSQFFASGGQSIRASASASVLPINIQDWFPLEWTDWISLQSKGLSRVFSNTTVQKHQFLDTPVPVQSLSRV